MRSARSSLLGPLLALTAVPALTTPAAAQGADRRYVEGPTGGMALPLAPLAGEHDARAVTVNPGGLALVRGAELALALGAEDPDVATSAGPGVGVFAAGALGGGLLPRLAVGLGLEWLRPARAQLDPDPGRPFRGTLSLAVPLGASAGLGLAWHKFVGDGPLGGRDTVDLGLSTRWGSRLAIGAALRDLATADIAGTPVQRRYELEAVVRPLGTDALDVAVGGRVGEIRGDVDGWARLSARALRGVIVHAGVESRALQAIAFDPINGRTEAAGRDVRATVGLELSFGRTGVLALATGLRDDTGGRSLLGGQLVLRASSLGPPALGRPDAHLERVELEGAIGLREVTALVTRLRAIARDPSAKGLVVTFDGIDAGWATLEELRGELAGVRRAGKKVFAYMVSGTGRDYFVASAADKIYVDPAGGVRLVGLAGTTLYFRGAFDQLGVTPQFEKIAEWKSAPEQFTNTAPSAPAAAMQAALFDSLYDRWLTVVAESRGLSKAEVAALVDAGPYTAGDLARDQKLVDAVAAPDKVAQLVASEMGEVLGLGRTPPDRPDRWQRPSIAVIYVDGDITDGPSRQVPVLGQRLAGSETLVGAIAAARANPAVGAIILRIDSAGGSALASELIAREVFATRGVKPILCSLSDLAASGGYFIAAGCDLIFAQPMTLTGSIGIFFGKFDVSGLLARLGVTTATQARGARADVESLFRPYTPEERVVLHDKLRYMYGRFVGAVAEGRGMTKEAVDAVGRGHVYTGAQARPLELVDRMGGLGDALDEAKRRMGLPPGARVALVELPAPPASLLARLTGLLGLSASAPDVQLTDLPVVRALLQGVPASLLVAPGQAQARLPFDVAWE